MESIGFEVYWIGSKQRKRGDIGLEISHMGKWKDDGAVNHNRKEGEEQIWRERFSCWIDTI